MPQFTGVNDVFPNIGSSSYNSLQMQATRHFKNGLAILGAYTWSKTIALTDNSIDSESVADVFNRNLERSITNYHIPHFFKMSWIYELPIGNNKLLNIGGIAGKVSGGWQVTDSRTNRAGNPISISTSGISLPTGNAVCPDLVAGQNVIANADAGINFRGFIGGQTYLNRVAFANPPVFAGGQNVVQRLGTVGPYLPNIRDRHLVSEDLSVQKVFKIDEHKNFELRGTFQNPFNRHGIGGPLIDITNPLFGQFTGQQVGPRNNGIALRFGF